MVRVLEGWTDWFVGSGPWVCLASLGWTYCFVGFGFSSGPIRMVFVLFDALATKAINFLRNGSGPIGFVLRPWRLD